MLSTEAGQSRGVGNKVHVMAIARRRFPTKAYSLRFSFVLLLVVNVYFGLWSLTTNYGAQQIQKDLHGIDIVDEPPVHFFLVMSTGPDIHLPGDESRNEECISNVTSPCPLMLKYRYHAIHYPIVANRPTNGFRHTESGPQLYDKEHLALWIGWMTINLY